MRIVYLHQYFVTPEMSGGTRSYEFARRLVEAGHEVHMITSDRNRSGKPYETVEAGIRVTWIPVPYSNSMGVTARIKAFLSFAVKSSLISARSRADVIFATSTPLTIAIPGVYAKWRQRIPMVFEVRDLWPEMPIAMGALKDPVSKWLARMLERFAYRNAEQVIALSPGMKEGVVATGYPTDRVTVIPNACDTERFDIAPSRGRAFRSQHEWLGDRGLVVYAGTLGQVNGVSYLADVAKHMLLLDADIRFLVVGSGKEESLVRNHARHLGVLDKNFFMIPSVPKADIPDVLSAADVCTSLFINVEEMWVNSANKFFDALAAGRPIVNNHEGWQAELIREHNIGLVLHPTNYQAAALALASFVSDKDRLARASKNAAAVGRDRFARDDLAQRIQSILIDIVNGDEREVDHEHRSE